jgi:hypothetical protein
MYHMKEFRPMEPSYGKEFHSMANIDEKKSECSQKRKRGKALRITSVLGGTRWLPFGPKMKSPLLVCTGSSICSMISVMDDDDGKVA